VTGIGVVATTEIYIFYTHKYLARPHDAVHSGVATNDGMSLVATPEWTASCGRAQSYNKNNKSRHATTLYTALHFTAMHRDADKSFSIHQLLYAKTAKWHEYLLLNRKKTLSNSSA